MKFAEAFLTVNCLEKKLDSQQFFSLKNIQAPTNIKYEKLSNLGCFSTAATSRTAGKNTTAYLGAVKNAQIKSFAKNMYT